VLVNPAAKIYREAVVAAHPAIDLSQEPMTFCTALWYAALMSTLTSDHIRLDERSLALHGLVAKKLAADPSLLDLARANVRRWQSANDPPSVALAQWERILAGPLKDIIDLLVERSEHATRLRQSSPFAGVLTDTERKAIYESYSIATAEAAQKVYTDAELIRLSPESSEQLAELQLNPPPPTAALNEAFAHRRRLIDASNGASCGLSAFWFRAGVRR
jgi:Protein of unknown function (DUF1778)